MPIAYGLPSGPEEAIADRVKLALRQRGFEPKEDFEVRVPSLLDLKSAPKLEVTEDYAEQWREIDPKPVQSPGEDAALRNLVARAGQSKGRADARTKVMDALNELSLLTNKYRPVRLSDRIQRGWLRNLCRVLETTAAVGIGGVGHMILSSSGFSAMPAVAGGVAAGAATLAAQYVADSHVPKFVSAKALKRDVAPAREKLQQLRELGLSNEQVLDAKGTAANAALRLSRELAQQYQSSYSTAFKKTSTQLVERILKAVESPGPHKRLSEALIKDNTSDVYGRLRHEFFQQRLGPKPSAPLFSVQPEQPEAIQQLVDTSIGTSIAREREHAELVSVISETTRTAVADALVAWVESQVTEGRLTDLPEFLALATKDVPVEHRRIAQGEIVELALLQREADRVAITQTTLDRPLEGHGPFAELLQRNIGLNPSAIGRE